MRKLNVTDGQTQTDRRTDGQTGGVAIYPVPGFRRHGDNKINNSKDSIPKYYQRHLRHIYIDEQGEYMVHHRECINCPVVGEGLEEMQQH